MSERLEALKEKHPDFMQRYDLDSGWDWAEMYADGGGDYVRYSDAAALVAALEEVEKERRQEAASAVKWADRASTLAGEVDSLRAQFHAREAEMAVLRAAISLATSALMVWAKANFKDGAEADAYALAFSELHHACTSTATAAQEWEQRIRREEREAAWRDAGHAPDPLKPGFFVCNSIDMERWEALGSAILGGEGEG